MQFIAHRGLVKDDIKENTIEAFNKAIESDKYIGFELDIRTTKDKEFVVYHDLMFHGKLVKNIMYKSFKRQGIPRLIDVLNLETNKIIMIEIKDFGIDLKKLAKLLNKFNYKKLYISCFNNNVLKKIKYYLKKIKIGSLNYVFNSEEDYKWLDFICLINYVLTKDIVEYFKKQNIEVFGYGVTNLKNVKFRKVIYIVNDDLF